MGIFEINLSPKRKDIWLGYMRGVLDYFEAVRLLDVYWMDEVNESYAEYDK